MKNIVTVKRINDSARRIYELPEDCSLQPGTLVQVETQSGGVLYGLTEINSILMDDSAAAVVRMALGLDAAGDFLKVKAVYDAPQALEYAAEDQPDADAAEDQEE